MVLARIGERLHALKRHAFVRQVLRTLSLQTGMLVASTIVSIFITRALGVSERGVLSWLMSSGALIISFSLCGLPLAAKKYIAENRDHVPAIHALSSVLMAVISVACMVGFYVYAHTLPMLKNDQTSLQLALWVIPLGAFAALHNNILLGQHAQHHFHRALLIEKGGYIALCLALLWLGSVELLWLIAASVAVGTVRLIAVMWWQRGAWFWRVSVQQCRAMFARMRHMMGSAYVSNIALMYVQTSLVLWLGVTSTASDLGYFAAAKLQADMLNILPLTVGTYATQYLMRQHEAHAYSRARAQIVLGALAVMLCAALPLMVFPQTITQLLFGAAFAPAAAMLPWLTAGSVGYGVIIIVQSMIGAHRQEWLQCASTASAAITLTLMVLPFADTLRAADAAFIYAAAMVLSAVIAVCFLWRLNHADVMIARQSA